MPRKSHWRCSAKIAVLKNYAIFTAKHLRFFLIRLFQQKYFPANIAKFLRTPILKNICEHLLFDVVFSSNEEQHLLAKLVEMR